jgi:type IX secretion system PorP/SprF family membrane protein
MKKTLITSLIFLSLGSFAQQRPHYTQYIMNNYIVNPAIGGIENYVDVKLSMRNQWVGIEGAPRTYYASIHGPIGKKDYRGSATSFDMKGENPRGREYWANYTAAPPHHGLGLTAINYATGYINRTTTYGTYSYHLGLTGRTSLAAGFGLGFSTFNINRSKITLATAFDPAIGNATSNLTKIKPELNAGLWLYSSNYFLGLSAQQIIPVRLNLVDSSAYKSTLIPHLFLTAGYRFLLNEDISVLPSAMFRYVAGIPNSLDVNLKLQYRDLMWIGANVRKGDGLSGMFGLNIAHTLNVSYAYDLNKGKYLLSTMNRGTHEIVLGFTLNNVYGDLCPRNIW